MPFFQENSPILLVLVLKTSFHPRGAVLSHRRAPKPQDILREFRATPAGRDATHNGVRVNDRIVVVNGDKSQVYFGRGRGRADGGGGT